MLGIMVYRKKKSLIRQFFQTACLFLGLILLGHLSACSGEEQTPEIQIQKYVDTGEKLAEERNARGLAKLISENYRGDQGQDKKALRQLFNAYFLRHKNIHLLVSIDTLDIIDKDHAEVQLMVVMADIPLTDLSNLLNIQADMYRFDLSLTQEKEQWLLEKAKWQRAVAGDF